jgi:PH/SEC7 domain-containing protein
VRTHEAKLKAMAGELREHRATQLGKKARGKEADEQRQKEAYLEFEVSLPPWHLGISHKALESGTKGMALKRATSWVTLGRLLHVSEP